LSDLAKNNLPQAINTIKKLDHNTMKILQSKLDQVQKMYEELNATLESGGRVFICGCGATGRLSLVL
jgi:N-acetylmuramic acid 6-phosphate etherase